MIFFQLNSVFYVLLISISEFGCGLETALFDFPEKNYDWDYLVFSQRWPWTSCIEWMENNNQSICNLPKDKIWTIHGLWPTKNGSEGPWNCPSAIHWDPNAISSIIDQLRVYWINVENNTKPASFWAHEWNKHGTCASIIPQLDSVKNYFETGLLLYPKYDLRQILTNSGITPNADYSVQHIYEAIKTAINVEPMIECATEKETKNTLLREIHICLDKAFNLMDCESKGAEKIGNYTIITNCSKKKPIKYPAVIPTTSEPLYEMDYLDDERFSLQEHIKEQQRYIEAYKFLKFLTRLTV